MGSIPLYSRTVTIEGCEYESGGVHITQMPRTFHIREYEQSQIELRMALSFVAGLAVTPTLAAVVWLFT